VAFAVVLGVFVAGGAVFAWPTGIGAGREVVVGRVTDFEPGTVTSFAVTPRKIRELSVGGYPVLRSGDDPTGGEVVVYVVRLENGELIAFSGEATPWRRMIVWNPHANDPPNRVRPGEEPTPGSGHFSEPSRGALWNIDGVRVRGPAPRDLDRYELRVSGDGTVIVDTRSFIEGLGEGQRGYER
jgi:hypothetical protein